MVEVENLGGRPMGEPSAFMVMMKLGCGTEHHSLFGTHNICHLQQRCGLAHQGQPPVQLQLLVRAQPCQVWHVHQVWWSNAGLLVVPWKMHRGWTAALQEESQRLPMDVDEGHGGWKQGARERVLAALNLKDVWSLRSFRPKLCLWMKWLNTQVWQRAPMTSEPSTRTCPATELMLSIHQANWSQLWNLETEKMRGLSCGSKVEVTADKQVDQDGSSEYANKAGARPMWGCWPSSSQVFLNQPTHGLPDEVPRRRVGFGTVYYVRLSCGKQMCFPHFHRHEAFQPWPCQPLRRGGTSWTRCITWWTTVGFPWAEGVLSAAGKGERDWHWKQTAWLLLKAGWHEQIMCPPTFSCLKEIIGKGGHLKDSWTCNPYPKPPFITAMSVFAIFGHNPQTWKPLKWIETRCLVAILVRSSWVLARMCITTMGYPESLLWDFATSDRLLVRSFQHKRSKFTLVSVVSLCPAFFMLC